MEETVAAQLEPRPGGGRWRLLVLWQSFELNDLCRPMFDEREDIEMELVSGHRTSEKSPHAPTHRRFRELKRRVAAGDFDLVVASNIYRSMNPPQKGFWTRLACLCRCKTLKFPYLDTALTPELVPPAVRPRVPVAAIDFRDYHFVLPWDWPLLETATCYFKREMFAMPHRSLQPAEAFWGQDAGKELHAKLRRFSWGTNATFREKPPRPWAERDIDVLLSGSPNGLRRDIAHRLEAFAQRPENATYNIKCFTKLLPKEDYLDLLSRSKIIVSLEGHACDNWRTYQAAAAGAVPLMNWPYTQPWAPFRPQEEALYFSLMGEDLEHQLTQILAQPERLEKMAQAAYHHAVEIKPHRQLGNYVINETLKTFRSQRDVGSS